MIDFGSWPHIPNKIYLQQVCFSKDGCNNLSNNYPLGHDSGLIVFKLERERPAYATYKDTLFYVKERYLRAYDIPNNRDVPVMSIRRSIAKNPRSLNYNPAEKAVLLCSVRVSPPHPFTVFTNFLSRKRKVAPMNTTRSPMIAGRVIPWSPYGA